MGFHLELTAEAERDFGLIYDHLLRSYLDFGESLESAIDHAEARVREILSSHYPSYLDPKVDAEIRARFPIVLDPADMKPGCGRW